MKIVFESFKESNERIYLDEDTAEYFGFQYYNEKQFEIINSVTLFKYLQNKGKLDKQTSKLLTPFMKNNEDLELQGVGVGWWIIKN